MSKVAVSPVASVAGIEDYFLGVVRVRKDGQVVLKRQDTGSEFLVRLEPLGDYHIMDVCLVCPERQEGASTCPKAGFCERLACSLMC